MNVTMASLVMVKIVMYHHVISGIFSTANHALTSTNVPLDLTTATLMPLAQIPRVVILVNVMMGSLVMAQSVDHHRVISDFSLTASHASISTSVPLV